MAKKVKPAEEWHAETDIWPVIELIEQLSIICYGTGVKLPCNGIADGCIGVMPVFESEATARAWAVDQEKVSKWAMVRRFRQTKNKPVKRKKTGGK